MHLAGIDGRLNQQLLRLGERRTQFRDQFVAPLLAEAAKLGLTREQLTAMITDIEGGSR